MARKISDVMSFDIYLVLLYHLAEAVTDPADFIASAVKGGWPHAA